MESAAADPQSKASARQVGLLPSAKSPKPSAEEKARSFDPILANPSGKAGFQKGKSTLAERSEFQNTYTNPDGTKIAEMSNLPLNVQGVDGEWRTIDKKVVKDGDGFRTGPHPVSPRFAERADDAQLVQASTKAGSVSLSLEGAADVAGVPSGEALVYGDVLDGVDLRYDVRQAQIEETLILTERSEPGEASWRFHLDTKLSTVLADDGSIELRDRSGNVAMTMPIPFVYDSSAVDGVRGPAETNGSMTLRRPTGR